MRMVALLLGSILSVDRGHPVDPARRPDSTALPVVAAGDESKGALRGGESRVFRVHLEADDYLDVSASARDIGIDVSLHSPAGEELFWEVMPSGHGAYSIEWIATTGGEHRVKVLGGGSPAARGTYEL